MLGIVGGEWGWILLGVVQFYGFLGWGLVVDCCRNVTGRVVRIRGLGLVEILLWVWVTRFFREGIRGFTLEFGAVGLVVVSKGFLKSADGL